MAELLIAIFIFVLGTVVGSFLNVCIYRLPRDESIVSPPSHCPACGERLRPFELLPLVSFLALGRTCRYCGVSISWRYFAVEFITGACFVSAWLASQEVWTLGAPAAAAFGARLVFAAIFIAIFFIDLDHLIIPDELAFTGIGVGVALDLAGVLLWHKPLMMVHLPRTAWAMALPQSVAGALAGALFFLVVGALSLLVFRREGMGGGDLKLGAAVGAFLGPGLALLSFMAAVFLGAVVGIALMVIGLRRRHDYIPFGPFMVVCAFPIMLAPDAIRGAAIEAYQWWSSTVVGR
jgi:leader peptidase (prepilin peptidase)/N-methyltransferase